MPEIFHTSTCRDECLCLLYRCGKSWFHFLYIDPASHFLKFLSNILKYVWNDYFLPYPKCLVQMWNAFSPCQWYQHPTVSTASSLVLLVLCSSENSRSNHPRGPVEWLCLSASNFPIRQVACLFGEVQLMLSMRSHSSLCQFNSQN